MSDKPIKVLYFKHVIENALSTFFECCSDSFVLDKSNGLIVFSKQFSQASLKRALKKLIVDEIQKLIRPYDPTKAEFFFMIGSCSPSENILLKYVDKEKYFPEKVRKMIENGSIKYLLKVEGIRIDLSVFNSTFEEIFEEFFKRKGFAKTFPKNVKNLFFLKNRKLCCYMTYRIIKKHFGKVNVSNMHEDKSSDMKSNLYSVNEHIRKYVPGHKKILESEDLKNSVSEMKQFLDQCVGGCI